LSATPAPAPNGCVASAASPGACAAASARAGSWRIGRSRHAAAQVVRTALLRPSTLRGRRDG